MVVHRAHVAWRYVHPSIKISLALPPFLPHFINVEPGITTIAMNNMVIANVPSASEATYASPKLAEEQSEHRLDGTLRGLKTQLESVSTQER